MNLALVFQQGDPILIAVFILLILMSLFTWSLAIIRFIRLRRAKAANAAALAVWPPAAPQETAAAAPVVLLAADARAAAARFGSSAAAPLAEALPRALQHSITCIMRPFDSGMTALATIGATAPFIGLFGTVWGIYHALINIGISGQISIAAVATPIGEALVATALGLFVAIPAVLAYNFLGRGHKSLAQDLHAAAHRLHNDILLQTHTNPSHQETR